MPGVFIKFWRSQVWGGGGGALNRYEAYRYIRETRLFHLNCNNVNKQLRQTRSLLTE